jgi:hypothetical protein
MRMAVHAVPSRSLRRQGETAVFADLELDGIQHADVGQLESVSELADDQGDGRLLDKEACPAGYRGPVPWCRIARKGEVVSYAQQMSGTYL